MAYELRMSDWSSAVCSSDLTAGSLDRAPPLGQCGGDFCTCEGIAAVADGADKTPLSFQDMILTLHNYWSARGCAILQPYDMRVGAGTFPPATTLRSLGPEPWTVAYEIGRASCRERVCQYVLILVVPVSLKKKQNTNNII